MNSFTHMLCKSIRLFEIIFPFCKTMPQHLQYDKKTVWSFHTPLAGLPDPDPSPINHLWDNPDCGYMTRIPSLIFVLFLTFPLVYYKCIPRLLVSLCKRLIECINKGGSQTSYDLQYMFTAILIFNKACELGWPSFY